MDYDQVSVADIVGKARCSVGAFYNRFPNKNAYLVSLIKVAFEELTKDARRTFEGEGGAEGCDIVRSLVGHVVEDMGREEAVGLIRASSKLGMTIPAALAPLTEYRSFITARADELLTPRLARTSPRGIVPGGAQIVLGTIIDAAFQGHGTLKPGSPRMARALSDSLIRYLGLPNNKHAEEDETAAEGEEPIDERKQPSPLAIVTHNASSAGAPSTSNAKARTSGQGHRNKIEKPPRHRFI
jgi:AcrR family transcriptional regulator